MSEENKKEELIMKAVMMNLGDEKFLSKMSEENLSNMISLIEAKDGEISKLKNKVKKPDSSKVIRVSHLVARNKIQVAEVPAPEVEAAPETEKDAK